MSKKINASHKNQRTAQCAGQTLGWQAIKLQWNNDLDAWCPCQTKTLTRNDPRGFRSGTAAFSLSRSRHEEIPEMALNSGSNSNRGFKRIHVRTRRWRSKNHARAISGGFRNPASRCRSPTRSRLRPLDANGDIGVSTDVLPAVRGTGHFGWVTSNQHYTVGLTNNGNIEPLSARTFGSAKPEPPTEGGWFLVGVFRALDTAKRRHVQATRSRIVPGTFTARGGLIPNDNLASHLPVRRAVRANRVPFGPA
jgi:hypothetical protein